MRPTVSSRLRILYAGLVLFAVFSAFTARSIWTAWRDRSDSAKAQAVFDLVQQRMPPRPTDAPGAMAWLKLELDRYRQHIADPERARLYGAFAAASSHVPDELRDVVLAIRPQPEAAPSHDRVDVQPATPPAASLRDERLAVFHQRTFVVTRRRTLENDADAKRASDAFVDAAVRVLADGADRLDRRLRDRPLPFVPGATPPRPVRLYVVSEDTTLVSLPWADIGGDAAAAAQERALLGARPELPAFAPQEFFFSFDPRDASAAAYSGFYLDLGGRGLVSTVTMPASLGGAGHSVVALDLAFDIDWPAFAAAVGAPVIGAAIHVADAEQGSWKDLSTSMATSAPAELRDAVREVASHEPPAAGPPAPLRHSLVGTAGAVTAFQVSDRTWLVMRFPKTAPAFPVAAVVLLAGFLAVLIAGFEYNRRRADDERQKAERALTEKQNLLNTMQVPLVVVDPNTDEIVSSNRAAASIGIRAGSRFEDLVAAEPRARAHYEKMQVASPEPRRAYGMPVSVVDEQGRRSERYALVRSVAVTAPIEALSADERHRLGVLFLLEPEADLALLAADIEARAHRDARRRLAGLLSHGVETLARVLEHCLTARADRPDNREFTAWLAEYLERRLSVTAWLLDHWDAATPLPRDSVVDAAQARATIDRLSAVFGLVRDDRELRSRLHWDNGVLARPSPDGSILSVHIDWPDGVAFTCPVRGGFGFFLGEVLANAIRHGTPGSVPTVAISCDRVRRELTFRVENATAAPPASPIQGEAYGGVEILKSLVRLFEWDALTFRSIPGAFVVEWRVPTSEKGDGRAD